MLLTDLFPFMRFGMFSETVKETPQKEFFSIEVYKPDGTHESLSKRQRAMDDSHLNYLTRKYYYQNNIKTLTNGLIQSGLIKPNEYIVITKNTLNHLRWEKIIIADSK